MRRIRSRSFAAAFVLGLVHYLKTGITQATREQRNEFVSEASKKPSSSQNAKP